MCARKLHLHETKHFQLLPGEVEACRNKIERSWWGRRTHEILTHVSRKGVEELVMHVPCFSIALNAHLAQLLWFVPTYNLLIPLGESVVGGEE